MDSLAEMVKGDKVLFVLTVEDALNVATEYVGRDLTDAEKEIALTEAERSFGKGYICGDWWEELYEAFRDTELPEVQ